MSHSFILVFYRRMDMEQQHFSESAEFFELNNHNGMDGHTEGVNNLMVMTI